MALILPQEEESPPDVLSGLVDNGLREQSIQNSVFVGVLKPSHPNGIDYNLRTAFLGNREDLPEFYKVLNSAIANPD
jgi:hypothetical protein